MKRPNISEHPWHVFNPRTRPNPSSERRLLVTHADGERLIANLSEGYSNSKGSLTLEEREANAQAIAAIPDLLKALELIYSNAAESPEWIRERITPALTKAGYTF